MVAMSGFPMMPRPVLIAAVLALAELSRPSFAAPIVGPASSAGGLGVPAGGGLVPPASALPVFDEDAPPRFSLPTESDRALWSKPGFRFGLSAVYGRIYGLDGAPNGQLMGPAIRGGLRLDEAWSLMASLQYLYATGAGAGAIKGLRFAGTLEPTWHATRHLSLAAGLGFGGIVETSTSRPNPDPQPGTLDSSYTFPNARTPLPSCNGVGVAGLLRAEWLFVLGPRAATGLALEMVGQWTGCVDDTGRVEPDTARPIVRRQWWPHLGGSLAWGILWR